VQADLYEILIQQNDLLIAQNERIERYLQQLAAAGLPLPAAPACSTVMVTGNGSLQQCRRSPQKLLSIKRWNAEHLREALSYFSEEETGFIKFLNNAG
jgi:hypothetical protein